MIDNEEGRIAVNSTRSYRQDQSRQGMKAVVDGRGVIPSIMSLFLRSANRVGWSRESFQGVTGLH
jgi:hypothetical protein